MYFFVEKHGLGSHETMIVNVNGRRHLGRLSATKGRDRGDGIKREGEGEKEEVGRSRS